MARSEARISVEIWEDPEFLLLSPAAQRLYMFLFSQRDLSYTGVMPLRERRWASKAAGLTRDLIEDQLAELDAARFVVVDEDAEELLVRSFIRQDRVYRQPQLMRSAADALAMVASRRIRVALADELRRVLAIEGLHEASKEAVEKMLADIGDPDDGRSSRSDHPTENPSPDSAPHPAGHPAGTLPAGSEASEAAQQPMTDVSADGDPSRTLPSTLRAPLNDHGQERQGKGDSTQQGRYYPPNPEPLPPSPSKTPSESSSRAARGATKRGTRIPDDFAVTPAMVEWARQKVPQVDGRLETEKFINYWRAKTGKDATKLDWPATWRNWMLNAAERLPSNGARASPPSARASGANRHVDDLPPTEREARNPFNGAVRSSQAGSAS